MTFCISLPIMGVRILSKETTEKTMVGKTDVTNTYFLYSDDSDSIIGYDLWHWSEKTASAGCRIVMKKEYEIRLLL